MILSYKELRKEFSNDQIVKKINNGELFKIEKGLYSNTKYYNNIELLVKKYPSAIFTSESAFFFLGLTDSIPEKEFLATKRKSRVIMDSSIQQIFSVSDYFDIGKTTLLYNNITINIYDKERMLIELARNKNKIKYDYYKEIIGSYRKINAEINISKLAKYLKNFKNGDNIFETIHREVF